MLIQIARLPPRADIRIIFGKMLKPCYWRERLVYGNPRTDYPEITYQHDDICEQACAASPASVADVLVARQDSSMSSAERFATASTP